MNSQESQQAYRHLIEQILECSSTDEALELLYGRDELVNPSLVQALEQVSEELTQQDNWDSAYLLKTIAVNLEVVLKNPLSEGKYAESLRFFQNLLQATASTEGNRQVVYPILKANLNKLDDRFIAFLKDWGERVVPTIYSFQSRSILPTFWYLGDLIQDFSLTDRAINLEIAIVCYEIALKFAPPATPNWMGLLHRLGNVYRNRIKDDPAENREKAIQYYENVLEVYNHNQIPLDERWVSIQRNLGRAYSNERIDRVSSDDQEKTIQCYGNALEFYNQKKIPRDLEWAHIQNDLAIAYRHRLKDDRALNLEKALECYREALKIYEKYPQCSREWGNTQNNLATSYCQRLYGNRIKNLNLAINHYKEALQVRSSEAFADKWAETQINMGNANRNLADVEPPIPITHDRAEYLEQAIDCYQKNALSELKPETSLESWFHAKLNLGNAYIARNRLGISGKNLKLAIECWEEILQVADGRLPQENLAMVQQNLAVAYRKLVDEHSENLNRAVEYCLLALKVLTDEAFPQEYAQTKGNLGSIYKLQKKFPEAYDALKSAINTLERLRGEIVSGDSIKQKLAEKFYGLYESMVEVCLNRALEEKKYYATAIEYVERSKARNLVDNIAQSELLPNVSESLLKRYKELQQELTQEKRRLSIENDENNSNIADFSRLNRLRQELDDLVIKEIQPVDEKFALTQRVKPITYKEIKKLLGDNHTAIIEWYMMSNTFLAFIIIPNYDHPIAWQYSPKDLDDFMNWLMRYWQDYRYKENGKFKEHLSSYLQDLANILHIDEIIDEILSDIPSDCDRLILIPHRFLHLFPLHALPQNNGIRLIDRFKRGVSFAPSCQLLQLTQTLQRSGFNKLFAIQNPTLPINNLVNLVFSDVEVGCIKDLFSPSSQILSGDRAKKEAIDSKQLGSFHCFHFSCHGYFNWEFPLKSALILANAKTNQSSGKTHLEKCLTLSEIFGLSLGECRLVTLSACETGLVDIRSFVDEYIGLPNGFLVAGSPSVVSSLWTVDDVSTCFLMIKFYENLIKLDSLKEGDVVIALNQAQKWWRNLTGEEFKILLDKHTAQIEQGFAQLRPGQKKLFQEDLEEKISQAQPFANPYYWSAFIATGV